MGRDGHGRRAIGLGHDKLAALQGPEKAEEHEMSTQQIQDTTGERDYFWLYVVCVTVALVGIIAMVKLSENDKYDPIRSQLSEEAARMNIRVLN
jgi:hypothetical protein